MFYKVTRPNSDYVPFCFGDEEAVARFLDAGGAPAVYEVTGVLESGDAMTAAVNGKVWLEKYRLDQLRRAALANTAPDDAPIYTCEEPPVWHEEAASVATVFAFLMHVPNALDDDAVTTALTMAISGIVRYENLGKKETTDFLTVHDYVWALIRAERTG